MKKIGIITFHRAHNYGAVIQALALQEVLKEKYEIKIIDYNPSFLVNPYKVFNFQKKKSQSITSFIKDLFLTILTLNSKLKRKRNFDKFINNKLNLSDEVFNDSLPENFDAFIFGSDQIWNHEITSGIDNVYWGNFKTKDGVKKISYAASLGHAKINKQIEEKVKNSLLNFYAISVREHEAIDILKNVTEKRIKEVLDPSLLLTKNFWNTQAIVPKLKTKYVLVYQVRHNKNTKNIANRLANEIGGVVIEIPAKLSKNSIFDKYAATSPEEFLGFFKNAHFVVTTSFHGTALSIIFNVPFFTVNLEDGSENRAKNLLVNVGLEDRLISKNSSPKYENIDYKITDSKIDELRTQSLNFLFESIEK